MMTAIIFMTGSLIPTFTLYIFLLIPFKLFKLIKINEINMVDNLG